jgi:hypothetical protein
MSETKVIEENGVKITLIYEIVDEEVFNSLVDKMDHENPNSHPFDDGPTSLSHAQDCYDEWKERIACPDGYFSLTEVYAIQKAYQRMLEEYKSGVREPDPVYMLYEELLPFFKDCYGNIDERVQDNTGYFIYDVLTENYEEFLEVVRLGHSGRLLEAYKLMEEIIDSFITEWEKRLLES